MRLLGVTIVTPIRNDRSRFRSPHVNNYSIHTAQKEFGIDGKRGVRCGGAPIKRRRHTRGIKTARAMVLTSNLN